MPEMIDAEKESVMDKNDFDAVLNGWNITCESERWSIKSLLFREYGEHFTREDVMNFLEHTYRKPADNDRLPIRLRRQEH